MTHLLEWRAPAASPLGGGRVRPLLEEDVPRIAELHQSAFGAQASPAQLESHLRDVFCRHPWLDERLPSLVHEDEDGWITGCLGVMPRPMSIDGRPIVAAVTHDFMVEPDRRSTLAAMQILKAFFSGPQDLSLAEGNDVSRKLWEAMGGTLSMLHSLRWTRPLRPARYALSLLERRGLPWWYVRPLRPFCRVLDLLAMRLPESPLRQQRSRATAEELEPGTLLDALNRLAGPCSLRPRYEREALEWLFRTLARSTRRGAFRKVLLRREGRVLGWYLYYAQPGGISEVVQIGATQATAQEVLDHLFFDAWSCGAVAVSGQLEPSLTPAFSERFCVFHRGRGGSWVLVHSRDERILRALQRDDAFFTRLEGEWWIAA